jgi:ribosomal protein S18 acetylase RimI-like enzyme
MPPNSRRTGIGAGPEAANAEKGRRAFDALVTASLSFLENIDELDRKGFRSARGGDELARDAADDVPFAHLLRKSPGGIRPSTIGAAILVTIPKAALVAEVKGKPAGTATTIRYGDRFGWIGMVLVHPDYRRFGIGTQLLKGAISRLQQCGVRCIKLDATPMGRKVYVPLGFVDEYELSRYEGTPTGLASSAADDVVPFRRWILPRWSSWTPRRLAPSALTCCVRSAAEIGPLLLPCAILPEPPGFSSPAKARARCRSVHGWHVRRLWQSDYSEHSSACKRTAGVRGCGGAERVGECDNEVPRLRGAANLDPHVSRRKRNPGEPQRVFGISSPEKG